MDAGKVPVVSRHRSLGTVGWALGGQPPVHCLEGSVFMAGDTVQWLRDGLQIIQSAAEVVMLAASVPDSRDVFLVPAFTGLGAPHGGGHARAALLGMTRSTTRAHIARAALDAIATQSADVFDAMNTDAGVPLRELRVDGCASANNLLMQLPADVLGVPVVRPRISETSALDAAYLVGLAVGVWRDVNELAARWQVDRVLESAWGIDRRAAQRSRWEQAVSRSRGLGGLTPWPWNPRP